jgi:hypothetical protein
MNKAQRDIDELEGTLLPPSSSGMLRTAQVVTEDDSNNQNDNSIPVATALPMDYFQYTAENSRNEENVPFAPSLATPEDSSPEAQERAVSQKSRLGSVMGKIYASEERDSIKRVSAQAQAKPYFEKQRIDIATEIAKRRNREGMEVRDDKYFNPEALQAIKKQDEAFVRKGGSYEVSEYDTKEYVTKDYEVSEYESVYD